MKLCTIGFTSKSANEFFTLLREHGVQLLIDIRLSNKSQLSGFAKGDDLPFFLREICDCAYDHRLDLAPTKDLLDDYRKEIITWDDYETRFKQLMDTRDVLKSFLTEYSPYQTVCLLCSEPTPEHCHRRLVAEALASLFPRDIHIEHL